MYKAGPFTHITTKAPGCLSYFMAIDEETKTLRNIIILDKPDALEGVNSGDEWDAVVAPVRACLAGPPEFQKFTVYSANVNNAAAITDGIFVDTVLFQYGDDMDDHMPTYDGTIHAHARESEGCSASLMVSMSLVWCVRTRTPGSRVLAARLYLIDQLVTPRRTTKRARFSLSAHRFSACDR